jgi:hypothetical protein
LLFLSSSFLVPLVDNLHRQPSWFEEVKNPQHPPVRKSVVWTKSATIVGIRAKSARAAAWALRRNRPRAGVISVEAIDRVGTRTARPRLAALRHWRSSKWRPDAHPCQYVPSPKISCRGDRCTCAVTGTPSLLRTSGRRTRYPAPWFSLSDLLDCDEGKHATQVAILAAAAANNSGYAGRELDRRPIVEFCRQLPLAELRRRHDRWTGRSTLLGIPETNSTQTRRMNSWTVALPDRTAGRPDWRGPHYAGLIGVPGVAITAFVLAQDKFGLFVSS